MANLERKLFLSLVLFICSKVYSHGSVRGTSADEKCFADGRRRSRTVRSALERVFGAELETRRRPMRCTAPRMAAVLLAEGIAVPSSSIETAIRGLCDQVREPGTIRARLPTLPQEYTIGFTWLDFLLKPLFYLEIYPLQPSPFMSDNRDVPQTCYP